MQSKHLASLSIICLLGTVLWLALMIAGLAGAGPLDTFDLMVNHVSQGGTVFHLTYANAAVLTVMVVMLFAGLYLHYKSAAPFWALAGVIFVPVYGLLNLVVYLSQITVVPQFLQLSTVPESQSMALFFLQQTIQQWPGSAAAVLNNLAYAVLGIPSIIFGVLMFQERGLTRAGGILLVLNGAACSAGFVGIALQSALLSNGSMVGGVLFLFALVCMSLGYGAGAWKKKTN